MAPSATVDHRRALVRGFIDGTLNAEEHAALEIQLRQADVARQFLREVHFDQAIRDNTSQVGLPAQKPTAVAYL